MVTEGVNSHCGDVG